MFITLNKNGVTYEVGEALGGVAINLALASYATAEQVGKYQRAMAQEAEVMQKLADALLGRGQRKQVAFKVGDAVQFREVDDVN